MAFPIAALISAVMSGVGMAQDQANKPIDSAPASKVGSSVQTELPNIYGGGSTYNGGGLASQLLAGYTPRTYGSGMSFNPLGSQGADLAPTGGGSKIPTGGNPMVSASTGGAGK